MTEQQKVVFETAVQALEHHARDMLKVLTPRMLWSLQIGAALDTMRLILGRQGAADFLRGIADDVESDRDPWDSSAVN
jgi:UV DNA damage repair endonuclease